MKLVCIHVHVHVCAACAFKPVKGCVNVHIYQVAVACVGFMRIIRVFCGLCRRAKLTPFKKNLIEAGRWAPIQKRITACHLNFLGLWEEELPSFGRSSSALAVACTLQPVPEQLVCLGATVLYSKIRSRLTLACARS